MFSNDWDTAVDVFGRKEILVPAEVITKENLPSILDYALTIHNRNALAIDYLYKYRKGQQPILNRTKEIRSDICNRIVENHASEITQFVSGYSLGEPVTYIRQGDRDSAMDDINKLNTYMFLEDKPSYDKELATWLAICGVGYRMVKPNESYRLSIDEAPFKIDIPDPRNTFVVYNSGFGRKRVLGVKQVFNSTDNGAFEVVYSGYTKTHYFEVKDGRVRKWEAHLLTDVPIIEYRLNFARMGAFEPALSLLDAINMVESNRLDSIEQFVQAYWKFIGCDISEEQFEDFKRQGAIFLPPNDAGGNVDVDLIVKELNQVQTQTLVDYLYDQVLAICGMPTSTKGGASTSDTGAAVFLRDGWSQCEMRAKDMELLFKKSEKEFLRIVIQIIKTTCKEDFNLSLAEVECKFTRRQHDNLLVKTQALLNLLEAGIEPSQAIAIVGIVNDPIDVAKQSEKYLEKWNPKAIEEVQDDGLEDNRTYID